MEDTPTQVADLFDREVAADTIGYTLNKQLRFKPLAKIDDTLEGQPGDTKKYPYYLYAGDAQDVSEGQSLDVAKIEEDTRSVTIKEIGKAYGISDLAMITGSDPWDEKYRQAGLAIANKMDNDVLGAMKTTSLKVTVEPTVVGLQAALDIFADEDNVETILIASPNAASRLRLDAGTSFTRGSELGAEAIISGTYGELLGVQVVRSAKLTGGEAYLVQVSDDSPALKLVRKRDVNVETERDALKRETRLVAHAMYAPYLFDETKVIAVTFNGVQNVEKPKRAQDRPKTKKTSAKVADKTTNVNEQDNTEKISTVEDGK